MSRVSLFERFSTRSLLIAAISSAFLLRILLLGHKSLWLDEANSLRIATIGQADLWAGRSEQYHPPLFYAFVEWWSQFGQNEFFLRLPSAILGTISVVLVFWLASELFSAEVAISALWLAALSPLLIWYAQEFRSYALLGALGLGSILTTVILLRGGGWRYWVLFVVSMLAALYTHYSALLLILAQIALCAGLFATRRATRSGFLLWLAAWPLILLGYWPWLRTPPAATFLDLLLGDRSYVAMLLKSRLGIDYSQALVVGAIALAILLPAGFVLLHWLIRHYADALDRLRLRPSSQFVVAILFVLLLLLEVIPLVYSLKRQLSLFWPFVLIGFAWVWPWKRRHTRLLTAILILSALAALVNILAIPKDQWREAVTYLARQGRAGDLVVLQPGYMSIPYDYYDEGIIETIGVTTSASMDRINSALDEQRRVWLVVHTKDVADPNHTVEAWFAQNATRLRDRRFHNLLVTLYQR